MKRLFGSQNSGDYRKELDERGVIALEEKVRRQERPLAGGGDLNAFLGEGTSFKGTLTFEGTVRVDGRLEGEIFTKDILVVGKSAEIRADIHAGSVQVSGTVLGNVTAERKVELQATARLFGNISTPSLVMAEGVVFEGSCTMGQKSAAKSLPAAVAESKEAAASVK